MAGEPLQFFNSALGCCDDCVSFGPCFIAANTFDGDLSGFTIEVGTFNTAGGLLEHTGAGLIFFKNTVAVDQYAPTTIRADPKVVSGDPAVSRLVIAGVDKQNYLFGEFRREGSCLLGRLGRKLKGADSFLTEYVTVFTPSATDRFEARVCWDPGADNTQEGLGGAYADEFNGSPGAQWTAETSALGPPDDNGAEVSLGGMGGTETVGFAAQFPPFPDVPEGAEIWKVAGAFRAKWVPLSGISQVTCTELFVTVVGGPGSKVSGGNLIDPLAYGWIDGATEDHQVTWQDLRDGLVSVVGTLVVDSGGSQAVSVDCVALNAWWRMEREEGVLRLVAGVNTPTGSSSTGEYGRTVAVARLRWLGTRAGIEPVSGSWNWDEAQYEYARSNQRPQCPECLDGCFLFGDTFNRDSGPGCHYEILAGSFSTVAADRILKVTSANGRIVARHIPTNKDNDQFLRVVCELQLDSDVPKIVFGYAAGTECLAEFSYNAGTQKWTISVTKDGGGADTTTQGGTVALTFPATVELAICLQDGVLTAQVGPVDSEAYYVVHAQELKDVTGTRCGVEAPQDTEFSRWRFYQTPLAGVDCPPCGVPTGGVCSHCAGTVPDLFIGILSGAKEMDPPIFDTGAACHVPLDLEKVNTAFLVEGYLGGSGGCCRWSVADSYDPLDHLTAADQISTGPCTESTFLRDNVASVRGNLIGIRIGPPSNSPPGNAFVAVQALFALAAYNAAGTFTFSNVVFFESEPMLAPIACEELDVELLVRDPPTAAVCVLSLEGFPGNHHLWVDLREARLRVIVPPQIWP